MLRSTFVGALLVTASGCVDTPITVSGTIDLAHSGCGNATDELDLSLLASDGSTAASTTVYCDQGVGGFELDATADTYDLRVEAHGCGFLIFSGDQVLGSIDVGLGEVDDYRNAGAIAVPTHGCE